jgi:methionyl aminopeptidase
MATSILSARDLKSMRYVCQMAAETLVMVGKNLQAGMTTDDINTLVHEYTLERDAIPAPLNYRGFPKSVCTSVNNEVCHGIPGPRVLNDGDIVNVDVTSIYPPRPGGWHGDTNATFYIGEPSPIVKHLVEVTRECLELAIGVVRPGARLGDIGAVIQQHAESKGCSVVRSYAGHGIGREFHCQPTVSHYGVAGTGMKLKRGMCFTIEPMINAGDWRVKLLDDDWTAVTADGTMSAQFEHTMVVTRSGCEVLTKRSEPLPNSEDVPWARLGPLSSFVG